MSIRTKLLGGFLAVAALTLAVGGFALSRMSVMNAASVDVGESWLPSTRDAGTIGRALMRMRTKDFRIWFVDDDAGRAKAIQEFDGYKKDFQDTMKSYVDGAAYDDERASAAE